MNAPPTTFRIRILLPPSYPIALVADLHRLEGSEIEGDEGEKPLGVVVSVGTESHGPTGPGFLQVGIKPRKGYEIAAEPRGFGAELELVDPLFAPDEPQKWRAVAILRGPK